MGHRKTPSLHIRYSGFTEIDALEIWAHHRGEKLVPWARAALLRQARNESAEEIIENAVYNSCLEMVLLLREIAGPEASKRALATVKDFKKKVKDDVARKFG